MRTLELKLFTFNELSDEAKQVAIETQRNSYYEDNEFALWAIDNCYLFEPKHQELIDLFGEDFYDKLNEGKEYKDTPLIGNNRQDIFFDCEARYRHLDCTKAMEVNNNYYFLLWLGIPKDMIENVNYSLYSDSSRYADTKIEFEPNDCEQEFTTEQEAILKLAEEKFNDHISNILSNIDKDIQYRCTDEAIIEDIKTNEYEYTEKGELFN